ncbi:subtilisin-like protein [Trametes gibbosa]|nr:subtilisin-like protein [Trametes gibbosa]
MISVSALLSFWLLGVVSATPVATGALNFRVHESLRAIPSGFTEVGPASPETTLSLRLALAQSDADGVIDALYRVSDPDSASYGQHLSKQEAETLVAPKADTITAVNLWLQENGLTAKTMSPAGDWLNINVPATKANELFNTSFSIFRHDTGVESVRTLAYSLPGALQGHVDLVHPTVSFPDPRSRHAASSKVTRVVSRVVSLDSGLDSLCSNGTTPPCLQALYGIPTAPAVNKNNTLGVTGMFGSDAHYEFLEEFLKTFRPDVDPATNFSVFSIDGGSNDQDVPSVSEGELDIQYTVGLATGVPITDYFVGLKSADPGDLHGTAFLDEAIALLALDQPPQVLTTSFDLHEDAATFAMTDKICQTYAQLGARGVTLLFAAGDSGAGCAPDDSDKFRPTFPSNCPFVTSVGGTQSFTPEEAWTGSSGGFSDYYPRPAYQESAVSAYLAAHGQANAGRWNASGRGFPDIAAKADDFIICQGPSEFFSIVGTSASSPTIASIFALVNDRLASAGRPPLGFLNPWLYKEGYKALTDITEGASSITCSANDTARVVVAGEGWDPVTGLGTPSFDKLLQVLNL